MPYPNFHSCRLHNPDDFEKESFRNVKAGQGNDEVELIIAKRKGETTTTTQAIRYPVSKWTKERALNHCKSHQGTFEAASNE